MGKPKIQLESFVNVGEIVEKAISEFKKAGVLSPENDCFEIVSSFFSIDKQDAKKVYELKRKLLIFTENADKLYSMIEKRKKRIPLQHILGKAYFYGYEFFVGKGVFVPRMETEVLVEQFIKEITRLKKEEVKIVDLCAGSGAIGITIAKEIDKRGQKAKITLIEKSEKAHDFLTQNAEKARKTLKNVEITAILEDVLESKNDDEFDAIISNPPYIPKVELERNENTEVFHDPIEALVGGEKDGLEFPEKLIKKWFIKLKKGGVFGIEVHDDDAKRAAELFFQNGAENAKVIKDLNGIERFVIAQK